MHHQWCSSLRSLDISNAWDRSGLARGARHLMNFTTTSIILNSSTPIAPTVSSLSSSSSLHQLQRILISVNSIPLYALPSSMVSLILPSLRELVVNNAEQSAASTVATLQLVMPARATLRSVIVSGIISHYCTQNTLIDIIRCCNRLEQMACGTINECS